MALIALAGALRGRDVAATLDPLVAAAERQPCHWR